MLLLLAILACETASPEPTSLDPKANLALSSMMPVVGVVIDPLLRGIEFQAFDLSQITEEFATNEDFGFATEGRLSPEEQVSLSSHWDDPNPEPELIRAPERKEALVPTKRAYAPKTSTKAAPKVEVVAKPVEKVAPKPVSAAQAVRKQRGKVQFCHETGKTRYSGVHGRITVAWTITGGRATDIQVLDNTTGDDLMAGCVVRQVRSFKFPEEIEEEVSYPFVFQQG